MSKQDINWDDVKSNHRNPLFNVYHDCFENIQDLRAESGQDFKSWEAHDEMEVEARRDTIAEAEARGILEVE